jgi:hypothetical protein
MVLRLTRAIGKPALAAATQYSALKSAHIRLCLGVAIRWKLWLSLCYDDGPLRVRKYPIGVCVWG